MSMHACWDWIVQWLLWPLWWPMALVFAFCMLLGGANNAEGNTTGHTRRYSFGLAKHFLGKR